MAAVMMLARRTPYLEAELLGLSHLVGPGAVCIDVGASAGLYTVVLSGLAGPSGRVHSVEPLSFVHPGWTRLLCARTASNVCHHAVALGPETGYGIMNVPLGRFGPVTGRSFLDWRCGGLGSNGEFRRHLSVTVPVETLDALCRRAGLTRLDFIKTDVEGAELRVLEGGQHAIESFKPALLLEIEARHTARYRYSPDHLVRWLAQRGYTMHVWRNGWQEVGGVCAQVRNYLFRPPQNQREKAAEADLAISASR